MRGLSWLIDKEERGLWKWEEEERPNSHVDSRGSERLGDTHARLRSLPSLSLSPHHTITLLLFLLSPLHEATTGQQRIIWIIYSGRQRADKRWDRIE